MTFYDAQPQQLAAWFQQIDTDHGGTLNVGEVQRALALAGLNYSGKFVNSLINMVDNDCSGQLSPQEFIQMHAHLRKAYYAFIQCDADRSGILTLNEMPSAIATLGFQLDMSPNGSFYSLCKGFDFDKSGRFDVNIFIAMARRPEHNRAAASPAVGPLSRRLVRRSRRRVVLLPQYVTLVNAQRVHARMQPMLPTLTFDVYVWSIAQL